MRRTPRPY